MAEKILNTRIQLKYDEYSKWSTSNLELKKGEIALAMIETKTTDDHGNIVNVPTVVMKVGTGATGENAKFAKLPYVSALAADVHTWAKQSKNDFVNTFLSLAMDDGTTMQSKLDGVFATDAELASAVSGLQGELATALASYYTKTEIDGMFETLRGEISDLDVGAIEGRVNDLETATGVTIPGLINNVDAKFADYTKTADLDGKVGELGYAKVSAIPTDNKDLTNGAGYLVAADVAGKADSTQVAADIAAAVAPLATTEALNNLASTHATDKQALEGAIALKADQSVVAAMYTNEQIDTLLAGKQNTIPAETYDAFGAAAAAEAAAKAHTDAIVEQYLTGEGAKDTIDTLNEIAAWIADDEAGAAKIISDVAAANTNASNAVSTANTASGVASEAKGLAEGAVSTANDAKTAALTAQNSASASATAAEASASAAAASASAASGSASAAAGSADTANTKAYEATEARDVAVGAEEGAVTAQEAAETAQSAAETAQSKAEAAQLAAERAQAAAEAAKLNAQENASAAGSASGMASEHATNANNAKKAAEAAQAKAEAAQAAAEASNTSATAIANEAKSAAEAATAASNAATQAVAGLHAIATSGNVNDLVQTEGDVLVFNCGDSKTVI